MSEITLKDAAIDDCGFIASLFEGEEYELYFAENDTTETEWRERFHLFSQCENKLIFEDGEPVGWLTYELSGEVCEIGIIVVRRELIGRGIGYRAFDRAISTLPERIKTVKLDVQARNTHALAFYKRYGFRIVGEELQTIGDGETLYYKLEFTVV